MYCGQIHTNTKKRGKIHRCEWCNQLILIGERYSRWLFYDGGCRSTVYAHEECTEAWMKQSSDEGGITMSCGDNERPVKGEK